MIAKKESLELAEMIGKWFEKEVKPVCGELDEKGEFPADLYEGMAELGLNIMCVPEEYGGLGLDCVTQTLIAEQIGRYEVGLGSAGWCQCICNTYDYQCRFRVTEENLV